MISANTDAANFYFMENTTTLKKKEYKYSLRGKKN